MRLLFNTPVPAYTPRQRGGTAPGQRSEKIARGLLRFPRHPAGDLLTDHRLQARSVRARVHQGPMLADPDPAQFVAPVAFVALLMGGGLGEQRRTI